MGIRAERLSKSFEGRKVLDDISFEIKDGEFVSFLAPTGEGKTTLMRILAGIERPDSGRVYYNDADVTDWPVQKRKIAMVFQWFVNYPSMSVFENIATPLDAQRPRPAKDEIEARVKEIARLLKIDGLLRHFPSQISGGQQQRLAIARALAKNSDFIFLDEPLTNLDYKLQEELRVELKNIFARKARGAVVFATPQPIEALTLSTSVGFLHGGRLLQFGPMQTVYHRPDYLEVASYFSHPSMNIFEVRKVVEDGHLWLKASDQLKLRVNRFRQILHAEAYMVGIRAHRLVTVPEKEMIPVTGTVVLREVVGSDTELHLDHQGVPLVALLEGVGAYRIGDPITVYLHPDRFFIFDKASHRLLARAEDRRNGSQ
jgi:ABC-type sugar transport system ATPase subunit